MNLLRGLLVSAVQWTQWTLSGHCQPSEPGLSSILHSGESLSPAHCRHCRPPPQHCHHCRSPPQHCHKCHPTAIFSIWSIPGATQHLGNPITTDNIVIIKPLSRTKTLGMCYNNLLVLFYPTHKMRSHKKGLKMCVTLHGEQSWGAWCQKS